MAVRAAAAAVSAQWLKQQVSASPRNLRILDSTWSFAKSGREDYLGKHIPGAGFLDLGRCVTPTQHIPRNIPDPQCFEDYVQELGIDQDDHVVIYDRGGSFFWPSARVWWQFRMFGHSSVSVLDGGFFNWEREGNPVSSGEYSPEKRGDFKVKLRPELMKTYEDMLTDVKANSTQILDSRYMKNFSGKDPEPSTPTETALKTNDMKVVPDISRGHLPGSIQFGTNLIFDTETGLLHSAEKIQENFEKAGVDLSKPVTTTCYNGMAACLVACGAALLGKEDVAVYYGSWTEFGQRSKQSDCVLGEEDKLRRSG